MYSRPDLEEYGAEFIGQYFPNHLSGKCPLDYTELLQLFSREDGVCHDLFPLGGEEGRKRLGRIYFQRKLIHLDPVLVERRISLPFVVAHECSHWLLHRDCDIDEIRRDSALPADGEEIEEQVAEPTIERTPLQWIEWQANFLASVLLIPKQAAHMKVIRLNETSYRTERQKEIIFENSSESGRHVARTLLSEFARWFGISNTVARIRL